MRRIKAIWYSIKYGVLPYWMYEREKHYECSYVQHLCINILYALRWVTFTELDSDIEFEKRVNDNE